MLIQLKKSWKQFLSRRTLLRELVVKGIKLKYRRSYLGVLWSLLEPILRTIVYTIVFGTLLGRGGPDYPLFILCGRLLYSYFAASTKTATKSIGKNASLIRKVYVPKYLYPMAGVLSNYITFLISLIVIIPLAIYGGVSFHLTAFGIVVPLIIILCMSYGVGLILATIGVFFRDIEYIWDVVLMVIMYTAAIFYDPSRLIKSGYGWLLKLNPMYALIQNFRNCIFGEAMDPQLLLYSAGFSVVVLIVGHLLFYKQQDKFILYI